ncbi:hypothetical protein H2200_003282 [Cladophialophora chaetospira]|uniref:Uncharacterized protein n=1 Tax=Cladophialophora chaetospira TaxID=386627 RepID=A0AA39CM47_9EURO|nr:hypothetical protein H2200_003282 [Cladophialophora chaetospira]
MARTLPWNLEREPPPKKPRATTAPRLKQERIAFSGKGSDSEEEGSLTRRGRAPKVNAAPKSSLRTPSSSPVRRPPSVELMHEGYDRDDAYIMVEDEFQTVAQSYTAHLHHAEYKRLVKQARQAPPKALPPPTSPMSKQAKSRLRMATLQRKQNETLQRVTGDESIEDDNEQAKVADLWSGTSLAPLMASGTQQKRSLVGLEGISSSTKAGLGFSRSQNSPPKDGEENGDDTMDLDTTRHKIPPQPKDISRNSVTRTVSNKATSPQLAAGAASTSRSVEKEIAPQKPLPMPSKTVERPVPKRRLVFDFDDGFDAQETVRKARKETHKPLREQEKKSRLDEVPMWL